MTAAFSVDLDRIDAAVAALDVFENRLGEQLADLATRTDRLTSQWSGTSADAFADAHREWVAGAARMADGIASMRRAADVARASYRAAVAANTAMFR